MHGWFGSYATVACGVERGGGISTHAHICFPVMKRHFLESWGGEEKEGGGGGKSMYGWGGKPHPSLQERRGRERSIFFMGK